MNKICTSLKQSKKLIELGIDVNTADMGWYYSSNPNAARNQMWAGTKAKNADIPAWSLSALLELIPSYLGEFVEGIDFGFEKAVNGKWYSAHYLQTDEKGEITPIKVVTGNTAVDAAFKMICWLKNEKI